MLVQRGLKSWGTTGTTDTITLGTPVPVGKSIAIATCTSAVGTGSGISFAATRCVLQTVVDGNYTELALVRGADGTAANVEWQVITEAGWTVQSGTRSIGENVGANLSSITSVDLDKAILFFTYYREGTGPSSYVHDLFRGYFNSATEVEFSRGGNSGSAASIAWYVVEWEGATVERGSKTGMSGATSMTQAITAVDLSKTFLLHSYSQLTGADQHADNNLVSARFSSTTEITFEKGNGSGNDTNHTVEWQVVSHPQIKNIRTANFSSSGSSSSNTITAVDADNTFLAYQTVYGNNRSTSANRFIGNIGRGAITSATNATITRAGSDANFNGTFYAVELGVVNASGTAVLHSTEPEFFAPTPEAGTAGTAVMAETEPEIFDNSGQGATNPWTNVEKPSTTWTNIVKP